MSKQQHLVVIGVCFSLPLLGVRETGKDRSLYIAWNPKSPHHNINSRTFSNNTLRKQYVSPIYTTCNHLKCRVQSQFMFLEIDTITGRFRNVCLPCDFPTFVVCRELFFLYVTFHKDRGELCCGEEQGVLNKLKLPLQRSSWVREERE